MERQRNKLKQSGIAEEKEVDKNPENSTTRESANSPNLDISKVGLLPNRIESKVRETF